VSECSVSVVADGAAVRASRRRLAAALSLEYVYVLERFLTDAGDPASGTFEWRQARRSAELELVERHPRTAERILARIVGQHSGSR
jgi:uncharacterized heparinase superfamily protein